MPAGDELFARPFHLDEAARPDIVRPFRERIAPPAVSAFDQGVALLAGNDFPKAETSFKSAIQADSDNASAALAYLAATFAAAGHDAEAASAWQTALIDGSDLPQIYVWLGDALMRTRNLAQARAILEEGLKKWPSDLRFTKPLAVLYATFGQGREALRTLERHLAEHPDDIGGELSRRRVDVPPAPGGGRRSYASRGCEARPRVRRGVRKGPRVAACRSSKSGWTFLEGRSR